MQIPEQLAALRSEGERMIVAAQAAGLDAPVPGCPAWTVRDLVFHTSSVQRWGEMMVREKHAEYVDAQGFDPLSDASLRPPDDKLFDWYAEGVDLAVRTLQDAPADLDCWSFLPAPSPLAFWVRRMLQETVMHRIDAEQSAGALTPVAVDVAVDGIDELLGGFAARRSGKLRTEQVKTLSVQSTDTPDAWHLTISQDPVVTTRSAEAADATLRGPAADLYLALWNRLSFGALDAFGDAELLAAWPEAVRVG